MKLFLFIIMFFITFTLSVAAVEYDKKTIISLKKLNVLLADSRENKIIAQGEMYVIIYNPTESAFAEMRLLARDYCKQSLGKNFTSNFMQLLGKYTAYFSCFAVKLLIL